ncbi:helix-turn-helix domain-containing protein [Hymenobacter sp. P5252]|uniref:Helix-turn-helix domain-containing protein n=1 Tax=Hymenobacter terrestris TaxID=2748310 RepID=A0ABX2PZG7_9BACT|nr:helix-turn-helix domain-containing protein [Hymenobacter terrestris]
MADRRQKLGLSQIELAELGQVSVSFITKLEAGQANPGFRQLNRVLDAVGLALSITVKS